MTAPPFRGNDGDLTAGSVEVVVSCQQQSPGETACASHGLRSPGPKRFPACRLRQPSVRGPQPAHGEFDGTVRQFTPPVRRSICGDDVLVIGSTIRNEILNRPLSIIRSASLPEPAFQPRQPRDATGNRLPTT